MVRTKQGGKQHGKQKNANGLYLIPTVTNGRHNAKRLIMEYRMVYEKIDMRKNFFKNHHGEELDPISIIQLISSMGIKVKGNRVIMKDSTQARAFEHAIKERLIKRCEKG